MYRTKQKTTLLAVSFALVFTIFSALLGFGQDKGNFTDARDGHVYRWAMFGKKAWMLGNLNYKTQAGSWLYGDDTSKAAPYGRLYDWTTAQKACPKGWHVPGDNEWEALITYLGGDAVAGGKLEAMDSIPKAFRPAKAGETDTFITLLAGVRHTDGKFTGLGIWGGYWSSTHTLDIVNNYLFTRNGKAIGRSSNDIHTAFSVKCVRNK